MPKIVSAATILLVSDVTHSANWYKEKLGFSIEGCWGEPPYFSIIQRDGHYLMLAVVRADKILPNWKIADKTSNVYFWVEEIDILYQQFIDAGATIDFTLYDTPWGTREFGINDPDGYDITFGQVL